MSPITDAAYGFLALGDGRWPVKSQVDEISAIMSSRNGFVEFKIKRSVGIGMEPSLDAGLWSGAIQLAGAPPCGVDTNGFKHVHFIIVGVRKRVSAINHGSSMRSLVSCISANDTFRVDLNGVTIVDVTAVDGFLLLCKTLRYMLELSFR